MVAETAGHTLWVSLYGGRLNALSIFLDFSSSIRPTVHVFFYFCAFGKKTLLKDDF